MNDIPKERYTFGSLADADAFLREQNDISRLSMSCVWATEMGLLSQKTRVGRVELTVVRGGGGRVFRLAAHEYVSTFPPRSEDIAQKLGRLNPRKRIVSVQCHTHTGGRALAKVSGAGGIRHKLVCVAYACGRDDAEPFVF